MIHVCFGLHDKTGHYSKFTGTAMFSLFDNTKSDVTVHILHDNTLTTANRDKFNYLAGHYGQIVKFYNVEKLCADKIRYLLGFMPNIPNLPQSVATCYRFLIPQIFADLNKIIYLDSDIIINLDINELWQVELGDKVLAVVPEVQSYVPTNPLHYICREGLVKAEDFFNAGILFMNLERLRREEKILTAGLQFNKEHPECDGNDQSILNYCFATQTVKLPQKFNVLIEYARMNNDFATADRICHYISSSHGKGYGLDTADAYNQLWLKYFVKTPWFDADSIGRLYAGVQRLNFGFTSSLIGLSAMLSGKNRAFFATPKDIDGLKKLFAIRDDEEIIPAENRESLQKLLDAMRTARGRQLFFIMLPGFPFQVLTTAGFVPGKDFVNGLEFLSVKLNPYPLIKAM